MKKRSLPPSHSQKLTIRITAEDSDKLTDLRLAMRARSDSETMRALIRGAYANMSRSALRAARAAKAAADDPRQLRLYGGVK